MKVSDRENKVCPHCGSSNVVQTDSDEYKCLNCHGELFFYSENNHAKQKYSTSKLREERGIKVAKKVIIGISVAIFVYFAYQIANALSVDSTPELVDGSPTSSSEGVKYSSATAFETAMVVDTKGKTKIVFTGWYNDVAAGKREESHLVTVVLDVITGREISRTIVDVDFSISGLRTPSTKIKYHRGANDELFLMVNNYHLFLYNPSQEIFEDVTLSFFNTYPELTGEIAAIDSTEDDQFLIIEKHSGERFLLCEALRKVYPIDKEMSMYDIVLSNSIKMTSYTFTSIDPSLPNEKTQLVQYQYLAQLGYPKYNVQFGWIKEKETVGVLSDTLASKKVLLSAEIIKKAKLVSIRDLTPRSTYVASGHVLSGDADAVIIAIKNSGQKAGSIVLQKLSGEDGHIVWTKETDWKEIHDYEEQGGYILVHLEEHRIVIINKEGDIITTLDLKEIKRSSKDLY